MKIKLFLLLTILAVQHAHAAEVAPQVEAPQVIIVNTPVLTLNDPNNFETASFSPDGRYFVATAGLAAQIWSVENRALVRTLEGQTKMVTSARFSPDSRYIVTTYWDGATKIWDAATDKEIRPLIGHTFWVWRAAFSRDGRFIVTASMDGTAIIWEVATGKKIRTITIDRDIAYSATFSPDGTKVAIALSNNIAQIWDIKTGQQLTTLIGHTSEVVDVAFSPDGTKIATGSADHTIKIWNPQTGQIIRTLNGHTGAINSIEFSPYGNYVLSASYDGTARIWDVETGQEEIRITGHTDHVNSASFSPDANKVITASNDKTAKMWDIRNLLINEKKGPFKNLISYLKQTLDNLKKEFFNEVNKGARTELPGTNPEETAHIPEMPSSHAWRVWQADPNNKGSMPAQEVIPFLWKKRKSLVQQFNALKVRIDDFERAVDAAQMVNELETIRNTGKQIMTDLEHVKNIGVAQFIKVVRIKHMINELQNQLAGLPDLQERINGLDDAIEHSQTEGEIIRVTQELEIIKNQIPQVRTSTKRKAEEISQ